VVESQALDVSAQALLVVPEIENPPDALDREAQIAGAADVIADGLGGHAGDFRGLPDIQNGAPVDARTAGSERRAGM
jgi:hypothetical protein